MKNAASILGIVGLALLFLAAPFCAGNVIRIEAAGSAIKAHPATYQYSYRYYRPVKEAGSRQCYWYYSNGSYVYVCR